MSIIEIRAIRSWMGKPAYLNVWFWPESQKNAKDERDNYAWTALDGHFDSSGYGPILEISSACDTHSMPLYHFNFIFGTKS